MNITSLQKLPFNIDLIYIKDEDIKTLKEVTNLSIFDNNNNFHSEGLFSSTIFGSSGSEYRNRMFAYIDIKVDILHPLIFYIIINLKAYYEGILNGSVTAIWDNKLKQFIKSNEEGSETGYSFFMQYITELEFEETGSEKRNFMIQTYKKAVKDNKYLLRYLLILPAGIRDYSIDNNGKPQEDEINKLYRKVMFQTSLIDKNLIKVSPTSYDNVRFSIQNLTLEIFEYIKSLLEGKHKLILGKWLTRRIFNTTRNVATSPIEKTNNINDPTRLKYNETYIGLYQFLKNIIPKSLFEVRNNYLKNIFIENEAIAYLVNSKTLNREQVHVTNVQKDYDQWNSAEGIEKIITNFGNLNIRHEPITLNNGKYYLGLIYRDDKCFKFINDINDVPEGFNKDNVYPITITELLYISVYKLSGKIPAFVTRYPITGFGSIYPSYLKLRTTNDSLILTELNDDWTMSENVATSFPIRDLDFFNTVSVHPSHVGRLNLDFDGDTLSVQAVLAEESIEELNRYLNSKEYYLDPEGKFNFKLSMTTLDTVLAYMTH
ncbi:MAG: putative RNA polymerase beta' subunit [uncultured bacterium]|nr:MAG: putative RNA polymerase beta' subunit [uncultured bacterium]